MGWSVHLTDGSGPGTRWIRHNMGIWYCTREDLQFSPDTYYSSAINAQIDIVIASASRKAESRELCNRVFYPTFNATKYMEWPAKPRSKSWRLWAEGFDIISVDTLVVAGQTIPSTDFFLEPVNVGPPYSSIEIKKDSDTGTFSSGSTSQRAIEITGTFGYTASSTPFCNSTGLIGLSDTVISLGTSLHWGIGSLLKIDDEWVGVIERSWGDTAVDATNSLTAASNDKTLLVGSTATFSSGQFLRLDAETLRVETVDSATQLTVTRAVHGSVLASHGTDSLFAQKDAVVERAILGTVATSHDSGTTVCYWDVPSVLRTYVIAEATVMLQQQASAYGRTIGAGDGTREARGAGLESERVALRNSYRRRSRIFSV